MRFKAGAGQSGVGWQGVTAALGRAGVVVGVTGLVVRAEPPRPCVTGSIHQYLSKDRSFIGDRATAALLGRATEGSDHLSSGTVTETIKPFCGGAGLPHGDFGHAARHIKVDPKLSS